MESLIISCKMLKLLKLDIIIQKRAIPIPANQLFFNLKLWLHLLPKKLSSGYFKQISKYFCEQLNKNNNFQAFFCFQPKYYLCEREKQIMFGHLSGQSWHQDYSPALPLGLHMLLWTNGITVYG